MLNLLFLLILSLMIDILWGEVPAPIHPVVWMGKAIDHLSARLTKWDSKISGLVLTSITISIFVIIFYFLLVLASFSHIVFIIVSALLLSTIFAIKGLYRTASEVQNELEGNVDKARELVSYLVSRDTETLSKNELASATVESITENINDSVTAPIFYILLAGILVTFFYGVDVSQNFLLNSLNGLNLNGLNWFFEVTNPFTNSWYSFTLLILPILIGVFYRVVNTLDAMVGYNNDKYKTIGYFPAKLDDIINFLPSRITGLMVVMASAIGGLAWKNSWRIMKRDAKKTPSPNSGYPMAAAAGALNVQLEKPGIYVLGKSVDHLDSKNHLDNKMIGKAIFLTKITIALFLLLCFTIYLIFYLTITII